MLVDPHPDCHSTVALHPTTPGHQRPGRPRPPREASKDASRENRDGSGGGEQWHGWPEPLGRPASGDVSPVDQHLTVLRSVSGSAQRTQLSTCRRPGASITKPSARPAWYADRCPPAMCRVSTSRDSRVHPGQRELLARRARRLLLGELGTGGAPTRLAPVPHDLPGGGVPPPGRRAQRPEVDLSVCDLQDLAIHAPALDPSEHEIAHGNPLELHRSHSARSRSASFCVAPHQLHVWSGGEGGLGGWPFSRPREAACRHRLEQ